MLKKYKKNTKKQKIRNKYPCAILKIKRERRM